MDVIVYAHTHWDREWYRPFQEFRLRLIDVIDEVIEQLSNDKMNSFYFDGQTIALEDYLEVHPYKKEKIKELIKNGKLLIGPWYALADEFLVTGESLIRNMLIGINQSKEFGCEDFTGYLPDTFGHNSEIPKILNSFNIKNSVIWRGAGHNKSEFIWKSQDGSSVVATYLIEGYFQDILSQKYSTEEKAKEIGKFLNKIKEYNLSDTILLPAGGDHLAPALDINSQIQEINKHINNYTLCHGSILDYISLINKKNLDMKEVEGELRDNSRNFILPGTLSTRLYLKRANAKVGWKLNKLAEPLQAFLEEANLSSSRQKELEYAWKLFIKNHPHDSICGCSVDEVHDEMMTRFHQVGQIADGLVGRCLNKLIHKVENGKVIVYNSTDYAFSGVIKVKTTKELPKNLFSQYLGSDHKFPDEILFDIQRVPVQEDMTLHNEHLIWVEDVLPHSITVIGDDYTYKKHPTIVETGDKFIKNSRIRVSVCDNGTLTLSDSDTGKEFYNLHIIEDLGDKGDTYNFCPVKPDITRKANLIKTKIIEDGKLRGILRLVYEIDIPESLDKDEKLRCMLDMTHLMFVDVIVHADSRRVEFKTMWENYSRDHVLQLKFKFPEKIYRTFAENTFGLIERDFNPDYSLSKSEPAVKNQELQVNTAPMQRFVWANGLGIITEGLPEYGVDGDELYITLLRSVGKLSRGAIFTRGTPAGPPLSVHGSQCLGVQRIRYAVCATHDPKELFMEADNFSRGIITDVGIAKDSSQEFEIPRNLLDFNNPNIYTYAVKTPANLEKGIIVRCMNVSDKEQSLKIKSDLDFLTLTTVNSLENPIEEAVHIENMIKFKPHELKSLLLK